MNDEPRYSPCTLATMVAWLATSSTMVGAWMVWGMGGDKHLSILLANSAGLLAAVAVVSNVRCIAGRTWRLLRVAHGLQRPDADVREFERR